MSKWMPASLGAEPKKVGFLIFLLVLLPVAYWFGNSSDVPAASAPTSARPPAVPIVPPAAPRPPASAPARSSMRAGRSGTEDFRPSLKLPEDFDLSKVDPTLRTDLLARVREVAVEGGSRSLFEFYTPPPPPPPKVEPIKPQPPPPPVVAETKPLPPAAPVKPPPPPIPLKYFGYEGVPRAGSHLRAFFVDGEDEFIAGENEMIRNRYRIVRIGTTSAEVEDTMVKNTQTLRIQERQDP